MHCSQGTYSHFTDFRFTVERVEGTGSSSKPMYVMIYEVDTLKKVDILLRSAIHMAKAGIRSPGLLTALLVSRSSTDRNHYCVKKVLEVQDPSNIEETAAGQEDFRKNTGIKYHLNQLIFENPDSFVHVEVYSASYGFPERPLAVKLHHCNFGTINEPIREALLQARAESRYSCTLLDIAVREGSRNLFKVSLIMELLERDLEADLKQRACTNNPYTEAELKAILCEVSDALLFAKLQAVAHRDIKPANLFTSNGHYKLGDFSSACEVNGEDDTTGDGSLNYISPEMRRVLLGENVQMNVYASDVFSLGITMLHLAKLSFSQQISRAWKDAHKLELAVDKELRNLPYSADFLYLLKQMLTMDPSKRPRTEQLLLKMRSDRAQDPADTCSSVFLAEISRGNTAKAEILLLKSLSSAPSSLPQLRNLFTMLYLHLGRYSESSKMIGNSLLSPKTRPIAAILLYCILGNAYLQREMYEEAEFALNSAVKLQKMHFEGQKEEFALLDGYLGELYRATGKLEKAKTFIERCLDLCTQQYGADSEEAAQVSLYLGNLYCQEGKLPQAETAYRRSLGILLKRQEQHPQAAIAHANLALVCSWQGRLLEAQASLQQALLLVHQRLGTHPYLVLLYKNLGDLYFLQGKVENALDMHEKSLELSYALCSDAELTRLDCYRSLAQDYFALMRLADGKKVLKEVLQLRENMSEQREVYAAQLYLDLAEICRKTGSLYESEQFFLQSCEIYKQALGETHSRVLACYNGLAGVYKDLGRLEEAEGLLLTTISLYSTACGENTPILAVLLNNLAALYFETQRISDAKSLLIRCIDILSKSTEQNSSFSATVSVNLAAIYTLEGQYDQAEELISKAFDTMQLKRASDNAVTYNNIACLRYYQGRIDEARGWLNVIGKDHQFAEVFSRNLACVDAEMAALSSEVSRKYRKCSEMKSGISSFTQGEAKLTKSNDQF